MGANAFSLSLPVDPVAHGSGVYALLGVYLYATEMDLPFAEGYYTSVTIGDGTA